MKPFSVDWTNLAEVVKFCQRLNRRGEFQSVVTKHANRPNYNITPADRVAELGGGEVVWPPHVN